MPGFAFAIKPASAWRTYVLVTTSDEMRAKASHLTATWGGRGLLHSPTHCPAPMSGHVRCLACRARVWVACLTLCPDAKWVRFCVERGASLANAAHDDQDVCTVC